MKPSYRLKFRWQFFPVAFVVIFLTSCGACYDIDFDSSDGGCSPDPVCGPPILENVGNYEGAVAGLPVVLRARVHFSPEDSPRCDDYEHLVSYEWEQRRGPDLVVLEGKEYKEPMFFPRFPGTYIFRGRARYPYCARDEEGNPEKVSCYGEWEDFTVSVGEFVREQYCDPPSAYAGADIALTFQPGAPRTVTLNGGGSHVDRGWGCEFLALNYHWTVDGQPAGSDVTIQNADNVSVVVSLSVPGNYFFRLEVTDTIGKTDSDTVQVTLEERHPCDEQMNVTVIEASQGTAQEGVRVTVVDSRGEVHIGDADADGVVFFDQLAAGRRRSVTARSLETVPALPGSGEEERSRYEITTVLDYCSDRLTIPLRLTASGRADVSRGVVTTKVPLSVFDMLPKPPLPFFYYLFNQPLVSGQFRAAFLVPVQRDSGMDSLAIGSFLYPYNGTKPNLPGNMASDDAFLDEASDYLDREVWGQECETSQDCPAGDECSYDFWRDERKCRDTSPLRHLRLEVPAGEDVKLALILGIIDGWMPAFMPFYRCFANLACEEMGFDDSDLLNIFRMRTLHVCLLNINVVEGEETDISDLLAEVTPDDCWSVDYQQQEVSVPADYGATPHPKPCSHNEDCDALGGYERCLPDPEDPGSRYCYFTYYRTKIVTDQVVTLLPDMRSYNPVEERSDDRLCSWIPEYAPFIDCGVSLFADCHRRDEERVPSDTKCRLPRVVALTALDFPAGHVSLPEGGRVVIGFDMSSALYSEAPEARLLVPSLNQAGLEGAQVSTAWYHMRNVHKIPGFGYRPMPGFTCASKRFRSNPGRVMMPSLSPLPFSQALPDAGLEVRVTFESTYTEEEYYPEVTGAYAVASQLRLPLAGEHDLPGVISGLNTASSELKSAVLSRVDRLEDRVLRDSQWRIYAPKWASEIELPADLNPFSSGDEVWVSLQEHSFGVDFDYDLFPVELLLKGQEAFSEDSYALVVP